MFGVIERGNPGESPTPDRAVGTQLTPGPKPRIGGMCEADLFREYSCNVAHILVSKSTTELFVRSSEDLEFIAI